MTKQDQNAKVEALRLAVGRNFPRIDREITSNQVIAEAQKFYEFLSGKRTVIEIMREKKARRK